MTDFEMDSFFDEDDKDGSKKESEVDAKTSNQEDDPHQEIEVEIEDGPADHTAKEQHASTIQEIDLASVPVAKRAEMAQFAENMGMKIKNEHLLNTAKAPIKKADEAIQMSLEGINDEDLEKIEQAFRISGRNLHRPDILFDGFPISSHVSDEIEKQLYKLKDGEGKFLFHTKESHLYVYVFAVLGIPKRPGNGNAEKYKCSPLHPHHFNRVINGEYRRQLNVRVFFNESDSKADIIWFKEYLVPSPQELEKIEKLANTESGWLGMCECEVKFDYPGSNGKWNHLLTVNSDVANYEHERKQENQVANQA